MSSRFGGDRRKSPRFEKGQKFVCFASGKRFVVKALNQGPGGAFLQTDRVLMPGTVVVLEPFMPNFGVKLPHLVAVVVYFNIRQPMGAGVRWVKAISTTGLSDLRKFLEDTLELTLPVSEVSRMPVKAEEHPVSYDFSTARLAMEPRREQASKNGKTVSLMGLKISQRAFEKLGIDHVRVVHSDAPRQKRAIIHEDASLETRDKSNVDPLEAAHELEEWMRFKTQGRPVNEDVKLAYGGRNVAGKVVAISEKAIAVQLNTRPPDKGQRVLIQYEVSRGGSRVPVILVTEVALVARDRATGYWCLGGKVVITNEGEHPGIFKRYLRTL